jgi:hypothetical protein
MHFVGDINSVAVSRSKPNDLKLSDCGSGVQTMPEKRLG